MLYYKEPKISENVNYLIIQLLAIMGRKNFFLIRTDFLKGGEFIHQWQ